jgi:hypothetical protein
MATTTPNYGWVVPTSTDLVKDGATAIETLGDSADATVKALNPETTLGDIAYRSATANTNTRLAIGSTGNILTVSGGVPAWVAPAAAVSGLTFIAKSTASGAATHTISNCFTSTYEKYRVVYQFTSFGAANNDMTLQLTAGGGATTSGYACQRMMVNGTSTGFSSNPYGTDEWDFNYGGSSYPSSTYGAIEFGDPQKASVSTYTHSGAARSGSTTFFFVNGGMLDNSTQYDGFKIVGTGGNFSADFYIYGYQKA